MDIKLSENELQLLRGVLSQFVIKDRTGELGILHGANRFVSTNISLKKEHRSTLSSAFEKLGLINLPKNFSG